MRALKSQVFAYVIAEMIPITLKPTNTWVLFIEDSSNIRGSGFSLILENIVDLVVKVSRGFKFLTNNNHDEYEAFIAEITLATEMWAEDIKLRTNLQLEG